jgi:hypothetical protein
MQKPICILIFLLLAGCSTKLDGPHDRTVEDVFHDINFDEIVASADSFAFDKISSTHGPENRIPAGTILLFKTVEGNYGKVIILNNTYRNYILEFKFSLYNSKGALLIESNSKVNDTYAFDFETNTENGSQPDFWWEWTEFHGGGKTGDPIYITPQLGSGYLVYQK